MRDVRDLRDPQLLGTFLLSTLRVYRADDQRITTAEVADRHAESFLATPDWTGDGFMSTNPADHHSKVDQSLGDLTA